MNDISNNAGIDPANYDWDILEIRVKLADKLQRQRFADTIRKLDAFIKREDAKLYWEEVQPDFEQEQKWERVQDYVISIQQFADITGRNRKTVTDWCDKGFLSVCTKKGCRKFVLVNQSIKKMKKNNAIFDGII